MSIRTSPWPGGVPCWADLTVPDPEVAKAFYAEVLGWSFAEPGDDESGDQYGGYAIAHVRGAAAAGIARLSRPDLLAAWTLYLASDDVDATAAAIPAAGGTVLVPPGDVGPMGRRCIAADPAGAVFGVWQAGQHIGASITGEAGGLVWEDLRSTDPDAARAFYAAVFEHRTEPFPMGGPEYHTFFRPDEDAPLGGMGGMMGHEGVSSHWLVYFAVEDAAAAVARAGRRGGTVLAPEFDTTFGRMACLVDPAGAVFWIVQPPPEAPRPDRAG